MDRKFRRKKWDLAAVKGAREHLEEIQDLLSRTEKIIAAEEARLANLPDEEDDEDDTYKFHELLIK